MKKMILSAGVLLMLASTFASCKKDYTCKCSKTYTSGTGSTTNDYSVYTYNDTPVRANERCNENTKTGSDIFGNYSINCKIQ